MVLNPGCVVPSIVSVSLIGGRPAASTAIVCKPVLIVKVMTSMVGAGSPAAHSVDATWLLLLALRIASRSEQPSAPAIVSLVVVTLIVAA